MKVFDTLLLSGLLLLLIVLPLHAQDTLLLGSKSDLTAKFLAHAAQRNNEKLKQALPGNASALLRINVSRKEGKTQVFIGEVSNHNNGTFFLSISPEELRGYVILRDQKKAYEYYAEMDGLVYLRSVEIDKVLCIEYGVATPAEAESPSPLSGTGNVPILESLPGAKAVMLLDFDGQVVTSSYWNGGSTIDAAPAQLSTAEIIAVWELVSEDFRPFELNITTNEDVYFAAPAHRRMRCIFTPTNYFFPNAGGVAYLRSFVWGNDTPCWVFNKSVKGAGEAASHELGHTLRLLHDGRQTPKEEYFMGQNDWAPIMGVAYYVSMGQWSKGEYPNASNLEDDLQVITTFNGFGFRTDDHGNSETSATGLKSTEDGTILAASNQGLIEHGKDVDVFSFATAGGNVQINANPHPHHPNLDLRLSLRNPEGIELVNSDPAGLSANINLNVDPGIYYLILEGVQGAKGAPSNYGSLGAYSFSGKFTPDNTGPTLSGMPLGLTAVAPNGSCEAQVAFPTITAADDCGIASFSFSHASNSFFPVGTSTVKVSATDKCGNTSIGFFVVEVSNPAPLLEAIVAPQALQTVGEEITAHAMSDDPDLANATWDWGDGSPATAGSINGTSISGTHVYAAAGIYSIKLVVEDQCGAKAEQSFQHLLVYNPNAEFITGGGRFYSPAGAYVSKPTSEGPAHFAYSARYPQGSSKPVGQVNITFAEGNLNFKSTTFEWLIITAQDAYCKGSGSINGISGYQYIISSTDGEKASAGSPDRIRLRIWDQNGNTVYDNQPGDRFNATASHSLEGGSIAFRPGEETFTGGSGTVLDRNLLAYPNPLNPLGLWLEFPAVGQPEQVDAYIYDLRGKLMTTTSFALQHYESKQHWQLEHTHWPKGTYLLMIRGNQVNKQFKLVKL